MRIANPVDGWLRVVTCSPFPDAAGEMVLCPRCDIDGVITAERLEATAVQYSGYDVPKPHWPRPGMMLPVTVDLADPHRFRIEWDQLRAKRERAFPRLWREVEHGALPALVNGLTPQQTEIALSGAAAVLGLVPTMATVISACEAGPSSAPGGTWDISVRVNDPRGGPGWDAVTRMSFSSASRRALRTAAGCELPVLVDPDNRKRILVDVARLS
jgi:hypothetical protein